MTIPARLWLRAEGLAVFAVALALYALSGGGWLLGVLLFFAPDLSFAGYLAGPRVGAVAYNLAHTYVSPAVLAGLGWMLAAPLLPTLALLWVAHIGFDRTLGYGLKLPTGFHDTHLGRIGRAG
jgi:hypothetical protein